MFEGLLRPMHWVVILVVALLVFGPSKVSELGRGLGNGIRSFKSALKEDENPPSATTKETKIS